MVLTNLFSLHFRIFLVFLHNLRAKDHDVDFALYQDNDDVYLVSYDLDYEGFHVYRFVRLSSLINRVELRAKGL